MTLLFFAILVVVNSAIWTYFDASRLRDAHHTGVGPKGRPPQAWAALVFFAWPVVFPLYLSKVRDEARGQPMRSGPPPMFESPGLNLWGFLSLVAFSGAAVAALLYFDRPRWALASFVCMAVGVFGGRKSAQSSKEQRFELGGAAWDMRGFRPVDDEAEDDEEAVAGAAAWSGGTDLPPVADRQGNFRSAASRPGVEGGPRPNLPRDVFSAPDASGPAKAESPPDRPAPPATSPAASPAPPPEGEAPITGAERPAQRPVVATDTRRLAEKARRLRAEAGGEDDWGLDEREETPTPPPPPPPSPGGRAAPGPAEPTEPPSPQPPPQPSPQAPPQAPPQPSPQPSGQPAAPAPDRRPASGGPETRETPASSRRPEPRRSPAPQPGGSYGGYAASSRSGGGINPAFLWLGGIAVLCLVAWLWSSGIVGGGDDGAPTETPLPPPVAATTEVPQTAGEPASGESAFGEPVSGVDPRARLQRQMEEWIESYDRLMEPIAKGSEEVDFDGFSAEACRELTRAVQVAAASLPEAPDEEVERLLRPAFGYLESAAEACEQEQETAWASSLLRAKDHTHEAQVLMDERYQYAGFLELEQESAIGVTRPTASMSGKYLAERGG